MHGLIGMSDEKNLLIFDCDGTLIESEYTNNFVISAAIQKLGYVEYKVKTCIKKFRGKSFVDIVNILSQETGDEIDHDVFLRYIKEKSHDAENYIKAVDHVHNVLQKINQKKCIASNGDRNSITKYLKKVDIYDFFGNQNIFTGDQVLYPKPAPDLFLYASEMLKSLPQDTIVIEDSIVGVTAAKKAKMKVIGFIGTSTNQEGSEKILKSAGADFVIKDLQDIFTIARDLNINL